ncbi:hypothetical protein [Tautonia plasticadhaerens]|uniref:Uncharacterized protein n=1 Tax=Tautonia plasticadhaerens TaxID=2527974 RepID=A0A518HC14_9BACT|nr:hypothetical protein [Tautonia plasticadhaerens]QDV38390.1 hypothetical protein ElP_63450 [Tautonia plasticadhaerens]
MNLALIDLDAPIVPDEGLGGVALREELSTQLAGLLDASPGGDASFELVSPAEARFRPGDGEVEIAVDVRTGRIFKLIARPGYRGTLFGAIRVGMTAQEAMRLEPRLYFDEAEGALYCRGVAGVQLDLDDPDPPSGLVPGLPIVAICVFAKEIETLGGQDGDWWTTG